MRKAITIAGAVIGAALLGIGGHAGLAQQAKTKLAPPEVFQPPFPYSLGIAAQGKRTIYVAGQVALNAKGELVGKDDPEAQARQVFTNMKAVLAVAGANMDNVVKITMIHQKRRRLSEDRRRAQGFLQRALSGQHRLHRAAA